ncbi:MAG: flavodoxin family protein [Candidatus Omnitrophica bacterium]|nr:flavodoxin family protein [Candidatus Omnitrophota bacterium]
MKALGILAGPRKGQVTDRMLDEVLRGLKERGAEVSKVYLYDLNIKPCRGCYACRGTQECVIADDFKNISKELSDADVLAFASPVYVGNVTSVAKAFFDRGISMFKMTNFGPKWPHRKPRKIVLITSCFAPFPFSHLMGVIPGCFRAMKLFFGMMKGDIKTIFATGRWDFNSKKCRGILNKAYNLGLTLN